MKLILVSGLSGSGKTIALRTLEDEGIYCIDNLHLHLLEPFVAQLLKSRVPTYDCAAVGIDVRSGLEELEQFDLILNNIKQSQVSVEIIFLQAETETLLKRYSLTRRKHPLSLRGMPLVEAIEHERQLLLPVSAQAQLTIDSSHTNVHQLSRLIRERVRKSDDPGLSILLQSFGFKHGVPSDSDFVFDVRCLPNPHWEPDLRSFTGKDPQIAEYLQKHGEVDDMFTMIRQFVEYWIPHFESDNRHYLTISIGCTGGQHRSVYMVERLHRHLQQQLNNHLLCRHRELT